MAQERLVLDADGNAVMGAVTNDSSQEIRMLRVDPSTGRLLVDVGSIEVTSSGADGAIVDGVTATIKATVKDLTNSNPLATQIVDGNGDAITSFGGGTQYTEDAAAAGDPVGTASILVRADTLVAITSADGDNVAARGTNKGELYVKHVDSIGLAAGNNNIGDVDVASLPASTNTIEIVGDVAQDAAVAGNPILNGGRASTAVPTAMSADGDAVHLWLTRNGAVVTSGGVAHDAVNNTALAPIKTGGYASSTNRTRVTSGDITDFLSDLAGRQITNLGQVRELRKKQTTTISASTTETTVVTAGGAGVFNDLIAIVISNTSASAARVDIRDATAGTILFSLYIPAGDMRGFALPGASIPQTTANNNWTAQSSASVTDLRVLAIYEQNL